MTREEMIMILTMWTRFSEDYLMSLDEEGLEKLYTERVEKRNEDNHS